MKKVCAYIPPGAPLMQPRAMKAAVGLQEIPLFGAAGTMMSCRMPECRCKSCRLNKATAALKNNVRMMSAERTATAGITTSVV